ncbi:unnamed protein product, partial [Phaeothamnion confervicola]
AAAVQRWAGTQELLALLNGIPLESTRAPEQAAELLRDLVEAQAKMGGLVEEALQPDVRGDVCATLLTAAATGHPSFAKLCVDAGLPSNLVHCLRIIRVIEFESAMEEQRLAAIAAAVAAATAAVGGAGTAGPAAGNRSRSPTGGRDGDAPASPGDGGSGRGGATAAGAMVERHAPPRHPNATASAEAALAGVRKLTANATARVVQLLATVCAQGDASVGEQVKPHLSGLLSLAVSAYPPGGLYVQRAALEVVTALMDCCVSSSVVWLLHSRQVMQDVVGELRHLCGDDVAVPPGGDPSGAGGSGGGSGGGWGGAGAQHGVTRSPGTGSRSPRHSASGMDALGGGGGLGESGGADGPELVGLAAEAAGVWLTAMEATVCVITRSSRFVAAVVGDFEVAGGYDVLADMVGRSGEAHLPRMLEQVAALVSAQATGSVPIAMPPSGLSDATGTPSPRAMRLLATNPPAFGIIRTLLLQRMPVLLAICKNSRGGGKGGGSAGSGGGGGRAVVHSVGGGGDADAPELEMMEMATLVAQKAVVMRLARWDRPHAKPTASDEAALISPMAGGGAPPSPGGDRRPLSWRSPPSPAAAAAAAA